MWGKGEIELGNRACWWHLVLKCLDDLTPQIHIGVEEYREQSWTLQHLMVVTAMGWSKSTEAYLTFLTCGKLPSCQSHHGVHYHHCLERLQWWVGEATSTVHCSTCSTSCVTFPSGYVTGLACCWPTNFSKVCSVVAHKNTDLWCMFPGQIPREETHQRGELTLCLLSVSLPPAAIRYQRDFLSCLDWHFHAKSAHSYAFGVLLLLFAGIFNNINTYPEQINWHNDTWDLLSFLPLVLSHAEWLTVLDSCGFAVVIALTHLDFLPT